MTLKNLAPKKVTKNASAQRVRKETKLYVEETETVIPTMLEKAQDLIDSDRAKEYGDAHTNFQQIADLWNATLKFKLTDLVSAHDVALCMIQVKIARLSKSPMHDDSILDVAGYAGCYDKITESINQVSPEETI